MRTLARQRLFSRRRQISRSSSPPPPEFVDQIRHPQMEPLLLQGATSRWAE
jgi:hypothetical protein